MNKTVKAAALALALALTVPLAACGGEADAAPVSQTTETSAPAAETVTTAWPKVGRADYKGKTFNINYNDWSLHQTAFFADAYTGEILNDACFDRISKVNEYLNIDLKHSPVETNDQPGIIQKLVLAGDSSVDLALIHNSYLIFGYISANVVMNWNDVPETDMDSELWNQTVRENVELNGYLPFASNDFIVPDVNTIFFNTGMVKSLGLGDLYGLTRSGGWTLDAMMKMASKATNDVNGDGKMDGEDRYGFVGELWWHTVSFTTSCGIKIISKENDVPKLSLNGEKAVTTSEKLYNFIFKSGDVHTWLLADNKNGVPPFNFGEGNALFQMVPLCYAPVFREYDTDFGILPYPKYDEKQRDYYTLNWSGYITVPKTASDMALTGKVSELLAFYGKESVIPAFRDVMLGQKLARDADSNEMLDIIFSTNVYDLGLTLRVFPLCYGSWQKDGSFASYYEANVGSYQKTIDDYISAAAKNKQS